jgi:hypothetical protein
VARISIGGGLARLTCATIRDAAQAMFGAGDFSVLAGAIGSGALETILQAGAKGARVS